jgi:hypothetical protein
MRVEVFYNSTEDFTVAVMGQSITATPSNSSVSLEYHGYQLRHPIALSIISPGPNSPITITKIVFDDFWELSSGRVAFGENHPTVPSDDIEMAADNNVLFFPGQLDFIFWHPIQEFLFR